jgi:hypothetical protein
VNCRVVVLERAEHRFSTRIAIEALKTLSAAAATYPKGASRTRFRLRVAENTPDMAIRNDDWAKIAKAIEDGINDALKSLRPSGFRKVAR